MISRRLLFAASTLALLLAGLYSGDRIFFIGFSLMMAAVLYAAATGIWALLGFKYQQSIMPDRAVKGQKAVLIIKIRNNKPLLLPYIKLYYNTPSDIISGNTSEATLAILPFQNSVMRAEFYCGLRGKYQLGVTRIEVEDLFGLFKFSIKADRLKQTKHEFWIYPRILELSRLPLPDLNQDDSVNQRLAMAEEAPIVSDIREYRYGDPLKRIHWKISSKLQEIQVKNNETSVQPYTMLFIDTTPCGCRGVARYEVEDQIVETAVAVSRFMLYKWMSIRLVTFHNERHEQSGGSPNDFKVFYSCISQLNFDNTFKVSKVLGMEAASFIGLGSLIVITHTLDKDLFDHLCLLKQTGTTPILFLVLHRSMDAEKTLEMADTLLKKEITVIMLFTDQRVDESLEAIV